MQELLRECLRVVNTGIGSLKQASMVTNMGWRGWMRSASALRGRLKEALGE